MIRFKDGKVDTGIDNVGDYVNTRQSIADALDIAVAALRTIYFSVEEIEIEHMAKQALRQIGADHGV